MALETLKDVKEIGGFKTFQQEPGDEPAWPGPTHPVYIDPIDNVLMFKIQKGPIKEVGVNGCQVDTIIHAAKKVLEGLNKNYPCRENACAITKLDEAIHWLDHRTKDRETRGVEGTSNA